MSVLVAVWTKVATSSSALPVSGVTVRVTVWAVFQFVLVKVSVEGEIEGREAWLPVLRVMVTVTSFAGAVPSLTVYVPVWSVVVSLISMDVALTTIQPFIASVVSSEGRPSSDAAFVACTRKVYVVPGMKRALFPDPLLGMVNVATSPAVCSRVAS